MPGPSLSIQPHSQISLSATPTSLAFFSLLQHHAPFSYPQGLIFFLLSASSFSCWSQLKCYVPRTLSPFIRLVKSSFWTLPFNLSFCAETKNYIIKTILAFSFSTAIECALLFISLCQLKNFGGLWEKVEVAKKLGGGKWGTRRATRLMWPQARGWNVLWFQGVRQVIEEMEFVQVLLWTSVSSPLLCWNYLLVPGLLSLQQCWDWITCVLVWGTLLEVCHVYNCTGVCVIVLFFSFPPFPTRPQAELMSVLVIGKSPMQRTGSGPQDILNKW